MEREEPNMLPNHKDPNAISPQKDFDAFSSSISHDLRMPLRVIQGYAQMTLEDYSGRNLDDRGQAFLKRIRDCAIRLDKLLEDLLAYTRLGSEGGRMEPIALDEFIDDICQDCMGTRFARIEVHHPLGRVWGHRALLFQVFSNLINNALKYVAPGVTPHVVIRSETHGSALRIWVEDNGIGIKPQNHQRIFEIFERLHHESKYPGSGLGLAIVRKAVESMKGEVGLVSDEGKGSRFWIELLQHDSLSSSVRKSIAVPQLIS